MQRGSCALPVIAELLLLKADPNTTDAMGLPVLGTSKDPASAELLVQHCANVNLQTGVTKSSPLGRMFARVAPPSAVRKLLELRADVSKEAPGGLGHSGLELVLVLADCPEHSCGTGDRACQRKSRCQSAGASRRSFPWPGSGISSQTLLG